MILRPRRTEAPAGGIVPFEKVGVYNITAGEGVLGVEVRPIPQDDVAAYLALVTGDLQRSLEGTRSQLGEDGFRRKVAIKRIRPHLAENADFIKMFTREARLAALLQHPVTEPLGTGPFTLVEWRPGDNLRLEARIDNLLDKTYQDHVAGINRAGGSDIPVGERLYGLERTASVGAIWSF